MRHAIAIALSLALSSCARAQTTGVKLTSSGATRALPSSGINAPATTIGCCGQQMTLLGEPRVFQVADGKAADGSPVPAEVQTEVYGEELQAKVDLPPGTYIVKVMASENSIAKAGERVFNIEAFSGNAPIRAGAGTMLAKNVDLLSLAGGQGKPYTIQGQVHHTGGTLHIVLQASTDNAKFSSIRIFDTDMNKVAWLFAQDVADLLRLPDTPPVVPGPILWKDATQPVEKRVADLVKRLTLREKIRQIEYAAPAIDRLGIPAYNYWSECLHGVARNGTATVFPQAIGMSATWDPQTLQTVGDVIATEARAKFNAWQADGGFSLFPTTYRGLTFWSPNINLFRDPRWGRGQETYGEDTFLTGTMGVAFIKGLQGDDPKYLKVVATAKHFAVHSGPESQRHSFNAAPPMRDFYENYLPHFEMAVKQGQVYSVMGAYNRVYGAPASASDLLLGTVLRRDWGFKGYVVSDCGAIEDIWANHNVETDRAAAAAAAVLAGCDLECGAGGADYPSLTLAVDRNLIGEGAIDLALSRVLLSRFKLGLFDPPEQVRYASIKPTENATPEHAALALKVAHESLVLLKNDGTLPLAKTAKKIAIVGPNADGRLPLLGNYNGTPLAPVTVIEGLRKAFPGEIVHIRGCDNVPRDGTWQIVPDVCLRPAKISLETGLKAEHFDNPDLTGKPVTTRTEKQIDFQGAIDYTISGIPSVESSSRWSGEFVAPADGEYSLGVMGGSAFRFTVGGEKINDEWGDAAPAADDAAAADAAATAPAPQQRKAVTLKMKAGDAVPLSLECWQVSGVLSLQL
ncbi:MAG TPA: glycoside hydrolase family 3 N-terminal domain-containing protein, partial [Phycisphaerae bacterium]|nr:glycoside hydrolase family 3 N-terminal domain-containing protein [Phycisphaerae bacterium]